MRVVITSATVDEWLVINQMINPLYASDSSRLQVSFHTSGVGILNTTFSLSSLIYQVQPDLIIQVGIAGAFDSKLLGKVVVVKEEFLGDVGVEENGTFKDIFDLKLEKPSRYPFLKRRLPNMYLEKYNLLRLQTVASVTVNEITTKPERMAHLQKRYRAEIESMEGAALHYLSLQTNTPIMQMRAISNVIGERDKEKWVIDDALNALTNTTLKYLDRLYKLK
jgi:futalosine hydrolase